MSDILKTQQSFARKATTCKQHRFEDLYHLICRSEWLEEALEHVLSNTGARTAGVDGVKAADLKERKQRVDFVHALQTDLKTGVFKPQPVKRVWIPKPGKIEKRGLGIPTLRDRVVQEVLRMLMEPIWESDFLDCSHGFRPGRRTMDCIAVFYSRVQRANKFFWVIEGDIRKCFDRINHGILLRLIRQRITDQRIVTLIDAFLKAGVMDGQLFVDTAEGTPQGGILSPLLANIYLHQLDLWWWRKYGSLSSSEKWKRRLAEQGNPLLVRYADDFVILWNGTHAGALELRDELKQFLWEELHLELTAEKTKVTHIQDGVDFLGFHLQRELPGNGHAPWLRVTPTKTNLQRFRTKIKALTGRGTTYATEEIKFKSLNRIIRGWGNYYRHVSFSHDARELDFWLNQRVLIWLKCRHQGKGVRWIIEQYKRRERTGTFNRWNWKAVGRDGEDIFIAKLSDIRLRKYVRRKPPHPYLETATILGLSETETPFIEPHVININPQTVAWRETCAQVIARDGNRCVRCGKTDVPLEVHHKIARRRGGTNDLDNLEALCKDCHHHDPQSGRPKRDECSRESRMR